MKKILISFFSVLTVLFFAACNNNTLPTEFSKDVPVTDIAFEPELTTKQIALTTGQTYKLNAKVKPDNATNKKLTYTSSNTEVASINADGKITAQAVGRAKITVKATRTILKEIDVTVTAAYIPVTGISLEPDETTISLVNGTDRQIKAHVIPKNATNKKLTYTSSNTEVVSVNADGKITAQAVGRAKITVKATRTILKEIDVTVTAAYVPVTGISLEPDETTISLGKGTDRQIKAHVIPKNATNKTLTFSLDNAEIASITDKGKITAKKGGSAVITIEAADGISKMVKLTVTAVSIPVTSIVIEGTTPTSLFIGETYRIMAKAQPDEATNKELTYVADNDKADVASDGTVTAKSEGTVTITVKSQQSDPEITATVTITIKQRPSIELIKKEMTSESSESNLNLEIKTLHGKLSYT
ncbi:MAG: Ig-like domain-containing protein, partial [Treponema sp.]